MHKVTCIALLSVPFAACGNPSHAAAAPAITIGACSRAEFAGQCHTFTWPLTGQLRGELVATLRHFADGKETVVAKTWVGTAALDIVGAVVLLVRQGSPLGSADERFVELRMPIRDATNPQSSEPLQADVMVAGAPFRLPASALRRSGLAADCVMPCAPNQINQLELWSETHAPHASGFSHGKPWSVGREILLRECVGGCETTVLTIEHALEPKSWQGPR